MNVKCYVKSSYASIIVESHCLFLISCESPPKHQRFALALTLPYLCEIKTRSFPCVVGSITISYMDAMDSESYSVTGLLQTDRAHYIFFSLLFPTTLILPAALRAYSAAFWTEYCVLCGRNVMRL